MNWDAVFQATSVAVRGVAREAIESAASSALGSIEPTVRDAALEALGGESVARAIADAAREVFDRPSVLFRPRIYIDGDQWCCLYGENIQDGVAGFGATPDAAAWSFDREWSSRRAQAPPAA